MTEQAIRVLLVEDSDVYRDSLVFLLGRVDGIEVVGAVATGASAASRCRISSTEQPACAAAANARFMRSMAQNRLTAVGRVAASRSHVF